MGSLNVELKSITSLTSVDYGSNAHRHHYPNKHIWALERSRIVDLASQDLLLGLGLMVSGRRGLSIEKMTVVVSVEGLNGKALKEVGD
jgi:hypothetical protein